MVTSTRSTAPVKRSIRITRRYAGRGFGRLVITVGKASQHYLYTVTQIHDGSAYRLIKCDEDGCPTHADSDAVDAGPYDVFVGPDGGQCDCPGHCRHGYCKHVEALTALELRDAQRPGCPATPPPSAPALEDDGLEPCGACQGKGHRRGGRYTMRCRVCQGAGRSERF